MLRLFSLGTLLWMVITVFRASTGLAHQPDPDSIPFSPAVNYGAGDEPFSVFCADLDGDSDLDLAVAGGCGG